jgi:hypothetical protein
MATRRKIHDLTQATAVVDADEFEVQKFGETITKRVTKAMITADEVSERGSQDDVIESSVGLQTDGSLASLTESWYLKDADLVVGLTDMGGAEANVPKSVVNFLRILDSKLHQSVYSMSQTVRTVNVTCSIADILACNATPKELIPFEDYYLLEILSITAQMDFNSIPYEAGSDKLRIRYSGGLGTYIFELPNAFLESAADCVYRAIPTAEQIIQPSEGIEMVCATPPVNGNSQIFLSILYRKYAVIF